MHGTADKTGATGLRSFIERIERLNEEKKSITEDIKQVKAEAKGLGYDVKALNQMIKERAMDSSAREEWLSICEVYRANLGMLGGTPLGEAARRRFEKAAPEPDDIRDDAGDIPKSAPVPPRDLEKAYGEARAEGEAAARSGKRVFDNPYVASDRRRAAWDEGFCHAKGSDGMDLPPHLRRTEKPKKQKGGEDAGDE